MQARSPDVPGRWIQVWRPLHTHLLGKRPHRPNGRYIEEENDHERDRVTIEEFARSAKLLFSEIDAADLVPAHSRIRAKLVPPPNSRSAKPHAKGMPDFIIEREPEFCNVVQLIGIESPRSTSAPAIAGDIWDFVSKAPR